jgi:hypothetical protein
VAHLEGELSAAQEEALQRYLQEHPEAKQAWLAMSHTRVQAEKVSYPDKQRLKKGGRVIAIKFQRATVRIAAAASIALLMGTGVWTSLRQPAQGTGEVLVQNTALGNNTEAGTSKSADPIDQDQDTSPAPTSIAPEKEGTSVAPGSVKPSQAREEPLLVSTPVGGGRSIRGNGSDATTPQGTFKPLEDRITDDAPQLAQQRQVIPESTEMEQAPVHVAVADVPVTFEEVIADNNGDQHVQEAPAHTSVGTLLASAIREKVLAQPSPEARPLDGSDALAMVDRGLKAISGDNASLAVERTSGNKQNFNLRVGNFAISASTGR